MADTPQTRAETDPAPTEADETLQAQDADAPPQEPEIEDAVELEADTDKTDPDKPDDAVEDAETTASGDDPSGADTAPASEPADPAPARKDSGNALIPLVLGGAVAAVLGAAAMYAVGPSNAPAIDESALVARLDALETALADLPGPQVVEDVITDQEQAAFDALAAQLADLDARLTELADQGITVIAGDDGAAVTAQLQDMQRALEAQRAETAALQDEMSEMAAQARAEIEAAEARAADLQAAADAQATQVARQSAIARIVAASETGAPFAAALADLKATGATFDGLDSVAETGIPSLPALQRSFPDAARAGLAESVKATMGDGVGDRFGAFLRAQVGARSLEARDGDDPDAILSRAEAALQAGDVARVLAELRTLPEAGQAAMAGWVAQAETRLTALETLATLTASAID